MGLTSRERVVLALNHKEPDRVPIDLGGMAATGIMVQAYDKLKKLLGVNTGTNYVYDMGQMLAMVEEPILKRFGIDIIPLGRKSYYINEWKDWQLFDGTKVKIPLNYNPKEDENGDIVLFDNKGNIAGKMPKGGYYFEGLPGPDTHPMYESQYKKPSIEEYEPYNQFSEDELKYLHEKADYLFKNTDYAILGNTGFGVLSGLALGGFNEWWTMLITDQKYVRAIYEKTVNAWIENLKLYYQAVGDKVCAVVFNDDLGTQKGEWMKPEMFKELIAPHYKMVWKWVHENTKWKIFLHSCGSIYYVINTLIDCGLDILNPVQCSAANMEPERLKKEFGNRLVFWGGGCNTQWTLPFGKPEEVREEVKERIRIFAPGGGFIFNQVHNIQHGTPPENTVAMFDTVLESGKYPIFE